MNHLARLLILGAVTMCGASVGYLHQAGFFNAALTAGIDGDASNPQQLEDLLKPASLADYLQRTERGWWFGGVAGALVGVLLVATLSSKRE